MEKEIAQLLLESGAVCINTTDPFTWASGIQSPIYCDNRLLISLPKARKKVIEVFCEKIRTMNVDCIAGTATAGIPHAAFIAQSLDLPMVYVRSGVKKHGRQNRIEGKIQPDSKVVLIEDLISTGSSAIDAADALTEAGAQVIEVMSIFSYGLRKAQDNFENKKLHYSSLSNIHTLLQICENEKSLSEAELKMVARFLGNIDN